MCTLAPFRFYHYITVMHLDVLIFALNFISLHSARLSLFYHGLAFFARTSGPPTNSKFEGIEAD